MASIFAEIFVSKVFDSAVSINHEKNVVKRFHGTVSLRLLRTCQNTKHICLSESIFSGKVHDRGQFLRALKQVQIVDCRVCRALQMR